MLIDTRPIYKPKKSEPIVLQTMQACLNELDYKNARVISDGHSKLTVEETDNLVNGICKDFYSKKIFYIHNNKIMCNETGRTLCMYFGIYKD
ncbi:MAG: hypothetical protein IPL26_00310 [Leptospiraceae bacterium]|nr:hypothetical protein [Leptospiraceae bacterium]